MIAEPARKLSELELLAAMVEQKARHARNTTSDALASVRKMMLVGPGPATDEMADIEEELGISLRSLNQASAAALRQVRGMIGREEA